MSSLQEARLARAEKQIDAHLDAFIESKTAKLAMPVQPTAKIKLRDILKRYARDPSPFKACVAGEMARFGPGRTEAICASLKNVIKNSKMPAPSAKMSESKAVLDGEVLLALDAISEIDLQEIFLEARALDEHGTVEGVALLGPVTGASELAVWGDRIV